MITVKPAPGKVIRDPLTHQFVDPEKGLRVDPNDTYWRRRLRDGDVVKADESGGSTTPSKQTTATKATARSASGASGAAAPDASATTGSGA